ESAPRWNHEAGRELTRDERRSHPRGNRVPSPSRLLPEGKRPGEAPILHHALVPAPRVVDEHVEAARLARDLVEQLLDGVVVGVVARHANDSGGEGGA